MPHPSPSDPSRAAPSAAATALFRQAAAAGRDALDGPELRALSAALDLDLDANAAPPAVAVRIGVEHTREFGHVISAGLGGWEGELAASHCRRDSACVHAAAELTDAKDFLALFRRTLAYRKLAALARRDGRPPPDAPLEAAFARLLALAADFAPRHPAAPFVLRRLVLDDVGVGERLTAQAARCEFGAPVAPPCRARSTRSTSSSIRRPSASSASRPPA